MANRLIDSCAHYSTAQIGRKWGNSQLTQVTAEATEGRNNGPAIKIASSAISEFARYLGRTFDNQPTWILGCRFKVNNFTTASANAFLGLRDAGTTQMKVGLNSTGTFTVYRGSTALATSTATISLNTLNYLEFKCTIDGVNGSYNLILNDVSILSQSGINTRASANNYANIVLFSNYYDRTIWYCDIYVNDGIGAAPNNGLWGDTRVDAYFANGDGTYGQLTRSGGTTDYENVDENPANDDTDYLESDVVGNKVTLNFTDMTHTPSQIFVAQLNVVVKKNDAGSRSFEGYAKSAATENATAAVALSTDYTNEMARWETDPNTGAQWTKTNINSAEFGGRVA